MKHFPLAFFAAASLILSSACGNHPQPVTTTQKTDSADQHFFPVADWIRAEISYVDSTPLAMLKYRTEKNHTDSAYIRPDEFNQLASIFLLPALAADSLEKNFEENSFFDKTTGYLTLTYTAHNRQLPLQRVDVLALPGQGPGKVKSVYMETHAPAGDTLQTNKMFWSARQSFLVITSLQPPGKAPVVRQLKVVWDQDPAE